MRSAVRAVSAKARASKRVSMGENGREWKRERESGGAEERGGARDKKSRGEGRYNIDGASAKGLMWTEAHSQCILYTRTHTYARESNLSRHSSSVKHHPPSSRYTTHLHVCTCSGDVWAHGAAHVRPNDYTHPPTHPHTQECMRWHVCVCARGRVCTHTCMHM